MLLPHPPERHDLAPNLGIEGIKLANAPFNHGPKAGMADAHIMRGMASDEQHTASVNDERGRFVQPDRLFAIWHTVLPGDGGKMLPKPLAVKANFASVLGECSA